MYLLLLKRIHTSFLTKVIAGNQLCTGDLMDAEITKYWCSTGLGMHEIHKDRFLV